MALLNPDTVLFEVDKKRLRVFSDRQRDNAEVGSPALLAWRWKCHAGCASLPHAFSKHQFTQRSGGGAVPDALRRLDFREAETRCESTKSCAPIEIARGTDYTTCIVFSPAGRRHLSRLGETVRRLATPGRAVSVAMTARASYNSSAPSLYGAWNSCRSQWRHRHC